MRHAQRGFTLIELMITVVIIGIIAAIAYPSYTRYMIQTRRSDAKIALTQIANLQEKYFSDCNRYARTLSGNRSCGTAAGNADTVLGYQTTSPEGYYTLQITAGNISSSCTTFDCGYTATATPTGTQTGDGALRIDALGNKQWDRNNNNVYEASENNWGK
jgi:type IV pilus assembly protein PilE